MPLTGKYLKYSPEITLEIFTLVYNKLIENEWTSINVMLLYNQFITKWKYIVDYGRGKQFYSSVTNRELTETTVQEILGYDPFVKEKTIPEYVECINVATCNTKVGEIFKCRQIDNSFEWEYNNKTIKDYSSWDGWSVPWSDKLPQKHFKPSTKEAFNAQNQPKRPLNQAVHCKTQEEWDFVTEKLGNDGENWFKHADWGNNKSFCISFEDKNQSQTLDFYQKANYQILSFQEWCDLNGYKMEKKVKFEVGKWYSYNRAVYVKFKESIPGYFICSERIVDGLHSYAITKYLDKYITDCSIEEIQQYLPDNHPNKITPVIQQTKDMQSRNNLKKGDYLYVLLPSHCGDILEITGIQDESKYEPDSIWISHKNRSFSGGGFRCNDKVYPFGESFRLATPEEINNHLISIGQIPAGEPLNVGIEPNKDGVFKYTTYSGTTHAGKTSTISGPLKMTLSIDDEELLMVNIIKTNTIKQLLNND